MILAVGFLLHATAAFSQEAEIDPQLRDSHQIEVYISEDTLQALYTREASLLEGRRGTLQGGVFATEGNDMVGIVSAISEVADPARFPRWTFEVGARAYGALLEADDQDIFGVALGGQASYRFGRRRQMNAALGAFYAPDILTFGEADGVYDAFLRLELLLREGLTAFVGYRLLEVDLTENRELDDHAHVGVRWAF